MARCALWCWPGYRCRVQSLALFALDDTLVDRRAAFNAWAEEFAMAHRLGDKTLTFLIFGDAHHDGPMDRFFADVCRALDLPVPPDQVWEQYRRRMPELTACRPETLDALRRLRGAGWRLGIVTNGMVDIQLGKIRNSGLDGLVDAWCISDEVGIRKPDPAIFRLAARRCGTNPGRDGWMIGNNLVLDIDGGQAAGLRTIWLQPEHRPTSWSFVGSTPDLVVDSVAEAVELLLVTS